MRIISIFLFTLLTAPAMAYADAGYYGVAADLNAKEKEALRLAASWSDRPVKPIQTVGGKVVYVYGTTLPTVIGSPMKISDIELEAGETVNEILVGDTARWLVESGVSGNGVTHVFVKPLDAGLETTLIVTTSRRVYHVKLVSREKGFMPYAGFIYQGQAKIIAAQERKEQLWATGTIDGKTVDLSGLDFNYRLSGRAAWKPVQVYNDGRQTFLKLPDSASQKDVPVLLAMRGKREQMVNYRVKNGAFIVDGLFDHLVLISGVGRDRVRVDIKRSSQ